jgi:hypothetical protein
MVAYNGSWQLLKGGAPCGGAGPWQVNDGGQGKRCTLGKIYTTAAMARPPLSLHPCAHMQLTNTCMDVLGLKTADVAAATRERSWFLTPIASPCTFFDLEGNFEEVYATFNTFFYLSSLPPPSSPQQYSTTCIISLHLAKVAINMCTTSQPEHKYLSYFYTK